MWLVVRIIFSSILQIWYVEVRISQSISEGPLEFEISRVDCIYKQHGWRTAQLEYILIGFTQYWNCTSKYIQTTLLIGFTKYWNGTSKQHDQGGEYVEIEFMWYWNGTSHCSQFVCYWMDLYAVKYRYLTEFWKRHYKWVPKLENLRKLSQHYHQHCKSYSHFFSKKFQHICISLDVNFNESLTNGVVSFEQWGPDV